MQVEKSFKSNCIKAPPPLKIGLKLNHLTRLGGGLEHVQHVDGHAHQRVGGHREEEHEQGGA